MILLEKNNKNILILPIIVSPCSYEDHTILSLIKSVNPLNEPLTMMAEYESEALLNNIRKIIELEIYSSPSIPNYVSYIIEEFFNDPEFRYQDDVKEFITYVFEKIETNPYFALTTFFPILNRSLIPILKNKDVLENDIIDTKSQRNVLITQLNKISMEFPPSIIAYLNDLTFYGSIYNYNKHNVFSQDQYEKDAKDCAIKLTHYLVWKYECWAKGKSSLLPRSETNSKLVSDIAIDVSHDLLKKKIKNTITEDSQYLDTWGIAALKEQLQTIARETAIEAKNNSEIAANINPVSLFIRIIQMISELRRERGYNRALKYLLSSKRYTRKIGQWNCCDVDDPCQDIDGIITSKIEESGNIMIYLNDKPILFIKDTKPEHTQIINQTLNNIGRLPSAIFEEDTVQNRIKSIKVEIQEKDELSDSYLNNLDTLVPMIAKYGLPDTSWLLSNEDDLFLSSPHSFKLVFDKKVK